MGAPEAFWRNLRNIIECNNDSGEKDPVLLLQMATHGWNVSILN